MISTVDVDRNANWFQWLRNSAWPIAIDLWIAGIIVWFFLIRIVGSSTGQRVLSALGLHHRA
jgi:hypothetical protein